MMRAPALLRVFEGREHAGMVGARVLTNDHDEIRVVGDVIEVDGALAHADDLE